jgi:hypothetical protein
MSSLLSIIMVVVAVVGSSNDMSCFSQRRLRAQLRLLWLWLSLSASSRIEFEEIREIVGMARVARR